MSGVVVPTTMKSMSAGVRPARRIASRAASAARSDVATPGSTMCRSRMPVRCRIHSSVVSTSRLEIGVGEQPRRHVGREAGDARAANGARGETVGYHSPEPLPGAVSPKYS